MVLMLYVDGPHHIAVRNIGAFKNVKLGWEVGTDKSKPFIESEGASKSSNF